MRLKRIPHNPTILVIFLVLVLNPLFIAHAASLQLTTTSEYTQNVHTYINSQEGNFTQLDKPIFPVMINNSQIQIGENWTITCPLQANHNYQCYIYGEWVSTSATAKTDYDIYVYNPSGTLESSHTEAAGFPEHLSSRKNNALFTPEQTGNYTFLIKNDARESQGTQQATFMIIENLECNEWYTSLIEGKKDDNTPNFHTSWTYQFVTDQSQIEIYLKIPNTLDMYEARLYLMNDKNSRYIDSYPLPWESGLYGNLSGAIGGYNFENKEYRGVTYTSCEYKGQDMLLKYTSTNPGNNLYYLVLIGEEGSGDVEFMIKTDFEAVGLSPTFTNNRFNPNTPTPLSFKSSNAILTQANLSYTIDNWVTSDLLPMTVSNLTCNATIPGQKAGTIVEYRVDATDLLQNQLTTTGTYTVKEQPILNIALLEEEIQVGQNITVTGTLTPYIVGLTVDVQIFSSNATEVLTCIVSPNCTFTASYQPETTGDWSVVAYASETQSSWRCDSSQYLIKVNEPPIYVKYSLYIIIGMVVSLAVGGAIYYLKFRGA